MSRHRGEDSKHRYGMVFIVGREVVGSIINCTPFPTDSSPSGSQRDHTTSQPFRSMHQPQTLRRRKSHIFYEQLDSIIAKTPEKDTPVVQGDWNAKVGPGAH